MILEHKIIPLEQQYSRIIQNVVFKIQKMKKANQ